MSILLSIIAFILIFSLLVLIHEIGHFVAARRSGVKVVEFGFGLPPRIWGIQKGDTLYSINWIPFGGFVRMHGEDPNSEVLLKDSKSFIGKPLRQRIKIVVAGVFMNFMLALLILTIGFGVGMQPFIVSTQDALDAIDNGHIDLQYGVLIDEVKDRSIAYEVGLEQGDKIVALDGRAITNFEDLAMKFEKGSTDEFSVDVRREDILRTVKIDRVFDEEIGVTFKQLVFLMHPVVKNVRAGSASYNAGVREGDILLSVNDDGLYAIEDYFNAVRDNAVLNYKVLRSFNEKDIVVTLDKKDFAYVTDVAEGGAAEAAGFQVDDLISKINGNGVNSIEYILETGEANVGLEVKYTVFRNGNYIDLTAVPDINGKIGIGLTPIFQNKDYDLDLVMKVVPSSVMELREVRYPFYEAPYRALTESWRLTKFTASMFMGVVKNIVQKFAVPDGVAGPVGIARMTHMFVQDGLMAVMRFVALLSLSLAVINILPFPALDGGRLLFFVVEAVRGRRLNPVWESRIHMIGFMLLMVLIAVITWSDIVGLM